MSIEILNLNELDPATVRQRQAFIAQLVQEDNSSIDLKRGVLYDLLFYYSGILAAANQENVDRVRRSSSLLAIEEDPTLADDDVVDNVLSNYGMVRTDGTASEGAVTIVVSVLATVILPGGLQFDAAGKVFVTETPFTARTSSVNVTSTTDRVLTPLSDGNYSFSVDVVALESGAAGDVPKDTLMVPSSGIPNYVTSYATADFSGGTDTETNTQFIGRLQEGVSAKALSNRVNMYGMLRDSFGFENYISTSIIGFGDPEMLRDRHSILPISHGGRMDWYIRTTEKAKLVGATITATLIEKTVDGKGNWQFSVGRDDQPGFYDITSIVPSDSGSYVGTYEVVSDIRSADTTTIAGELSPDLATATEAVYSRFQSAVIQFKDHDTDTAALTINSSTQDYTVTFRMMPQIADAQTLMGSRDNRNYAGDALAKAPVPCFVSLAFNIEAPPGAVVSSVEVIAEDLASYVNNLGFVGRLSSSALSDIVHNHIGIFTISSIDMLGQILRPDGTVKPLRSLETLVIPDEPENMVTARTVAFILDPADVQVSVQLVAIPEI